MAVAFHGWQELVSSPDHVSSLKDKLNELLLERAPNVTVSHLTLGPEAPAVRFLAFSPTAADAPPSSASSTDLAAAASPVAGVDTTVEFAYKGSASITFRLHNMEANCLDTERKYGRVGLRSRQMMGMYDADKSLRVPFSLTLSGIHISGVVDVQADKETVQIQLGGQPGQTQSVLHNIVVNSSFDGSASGVAVQKSVETKLFAAVEQLCQKPLTIPLPRKKTQLSS